MTTTNIITTTTNIITWLSMPEHRLLLMMLLALFAFCLMYLGIRSAYAFQSWVYRHGITIYKDTIDFTNFDFTLPHDTKVTTKNAFFFFNNTNTVFLANKPFILSWYFYYYASHSICNATGIITPDKKIKITAKIPYIHVIGTAIFILSFGYISYIYGEALYPILAFSALILAASLATEIYKIKRSINQLHAYIVNESNLADDYY